MNRQKFVIGMLGLIALMSLASCAPSTPTPTPTPETVLITLGDFTIEASMTRFEAGRTYEFVITNDGTLNHEFRIIPPAESGMAMHSDEMHSEALLVVEQDQLPPGETVTVEYTFPASEAGEPLEFACHTPGHYEAGMKQSITLTQ